MELQAIYVQILALVIFAIGLMVAVSRRNVFFVLMASIVGQVVPLFSIAVAAAEACVGLAMVILIFRNRESVDADTYSNMKG